MKTIIQYFRTHRYVWWGLFVPCYLAAFFTIEHFITDNYWATQLPIDDLIPFCKYFIVVYDLWAPLLVVTGLYLIVKDPEGFRRYMWSLMFTFTVSTIFCILVPNGQDLRPAAVEGGDIFAAIVRATYAVDTNTNVFPSVHVVGVTSALAAVYKTPGLRKWGWRAGCTALGLVIIASTLLVKQHAFIDILAGLAVGALGYFVIYGVIGRRRDRRMKRE
jgi:membrane-associated phospholipid phosphatase